jgi:glycosyltransferase involved in cell wall biosynthesis
LTSRLTLDVTPLFEDHWTGIPIFTRRLVQALLRHGGVELEFCHRLTLIPTAAVLAAIRAGTGTFLRADYERNAGKSYPLIDRKIPLLYPSVKEFSGVAEREASTVHDVSTLVMPETHDMANVIYHMRPLVRQLATDEVVFCVSEATRAALTLAYPSVARKTRLLPQYVDWPESFEAIERNLPPPVAGRYSAVVGTVEPRKNLSLLIRALKEPSIRDSDLRFVVMGKQGWKVDEILAELMPAERQRLVFMGFVTEFMKYRLLRHAEFLVYPSLYEGFGIPALEAMSLGKPVLAAMTSSFPEIISSTGVYFDGLCASQFAVTIQDAYKKQEKSESTNWPDRTNDVFTWRVVAESVVKWVLNRRPL